MQNPIEKSVVPVEMIQNKIYLIRGQKVMLDRDLAVLYEVETKVLKQAVKRNLKRFPDDFMFELTWEEAESSRSQIVTLKKGLNIKYLPYAFTEQGVAMLSSILHSDQAIAVNIQIMRVFARLREMMASHKDLGRKIEDLERKFEGRSQEQDKKISMIFEAIKRLMRDTEEEAKKKASLGFRANRG